MIAAKAINTKARVIFDAELSGFVYSIGKGQEQTLCMFLDFLVKLTNISILTNIYVNEDIQP